MGVSQSFPGCPGQLLAVHEVVEDVPEGYYCQFDAAVFGEIGDQLVVYVGGVGEGGGGGRGGGGRGGEEAEG